jgi:hypothetical protein
MSAVVWQHGQEEADLIERSEISQYQIAIYLVFKNSPNQWMSNADVAAVAGWHHAEDRARAHAC